MTEQRAWEQVLDHIETLLLDGKLHPGDRLPGERALSADLGVGRSSVREALRVLEAMGLIRTSTGSGPAAGAIIVARPRGAMSSLMRLQVAANAFPVADIVQTRLLLEGSVAHTLATTEPDLATVRRLLAAMDEPGITQDDFLALDAAFHIALAEAAHNSVVTATMAGLRGAIEGYVREGAAHINFDDMIVVLRREHHGIVAAIESGDPDRARAGITDHISGYYAAISLGERTPSW